MDKPTFVYVTYIETTAQKVWAALTDPELSARYWGRSNVSDWQVGSPWAHKFPDQPADIVGTVLESEPPHRLVVSWARPDRVDDPAAVSRLTYLIEPLGEKVRLTLTHADLYEKMFHDISGGWPAVLSNLKTFLETGRPMPDPFSGVGEARSRAEASA